MLDSQYLSMEVVVPESGGSLDKARLRPTPAPILCGSLKQMLPPKHPSQTVLHDVASAWKWCGQRGRRQPWQAADAANAGRPSCDIHWVLEADAAA